MEHLTQIAAHLSPTAQDFLDYVTSDPARMQPLDHLAGDYPDWLRNASGRYYPLQSWPTFVGAEKLAEVRRATVELTRLVTGIPERLFGNDPRRIGAYYGFRNEALVALLLAPPNGLDGALIRNDFLDTAEGLRCLEVNAGHIGGWQLRYFEEQVRASPVIARFLAERGLAPHHRDPLAVMMRHIIADNLGKPTAAEGTLNAAITIGHPSQASEAPRLGRLYREALQETGQGLTGELVLCACSELAVRHHQVWQGDRPIHAIVELIPQMLPEGIFRCFKMGRVSLYNGPINPLLNDKRNLALLSEHADSAVFSAEEREVLRRHLPWTRSVTAAAATFRGDTRPLPELLTARREEFVLKPATGSQGRGVTLGRSTPLDVWARLIQDAVRQGRWLVQERVESRPYVYQHGEQGYAIHDVVWGTFCFGQTYGGGFLRMIPSGAGDGVINSARGATEGILFEV